MKVRNLIPTSKEDIDTVNKLYQYEFYLIKPIVPNLLVWIQDMNWPIGVYMANYLRSHINSIVDELLEILNSDDDPMWKYWVLVLFLKFEARLDSRLIEKIKSLRDNPSILDKENEIDEVAADVLEANSKWWG